MMKREKEFDDDRNGWYRIDPLQAQMWLDGAPILRPKRDQWAQRLSSYMERGMWAMTGEPIICYADGRLAEGQHRCRACIISQQSFLTFVVFVPKRVTATFYDWINHNLSRSLGDRVSEMSPDLKNHAMIAAVARLGVKYDREGSSIARGTKANNVDPVDARKFVEQNLSEIALCTSRTSARSSALKGKIATSLVAHGYLRARAVHAEQAEAWFEGITTGANLPASSPMLALLKFLTRAGTVRVSPLAQKTALVKSWIYFHHGRDVKSIVVKPGTPVLRYCDGLLALRLRENEDADASA